MNKLIDFFMKNNKNKLNIKVTSGGRMYIETSDFFKIKKVQDTIELLSKSDLIKNIDNINKA